MRTLHGMPDAVYHARALAIANGDRSLVHADLGRRVTLDAATVECSASLSMTTAPAGQALRLSGTVQVDADSGWILDREGVVVGLAERAPMVDRPDPSGAEIFSALRRAIASGELFSHSRWLGFAPAAAQRPLTFVATGAGTVRCRTSLLGNSRNHLPGVIQELDSRIARGIDR
jgi:hypothetical protein